jgi:putative signal transducing protein
MGIRGWAVVYKGERFQAEIIAAALIAEGIRAEVFGDSAYGVGINLTEARLMVPDDQAEAARRVIREAESRPPEQPEEEV